ncbi:MAG: hypothetical protein AAF661_05375 [Pseudomonadota bacterium]
MKRQKRKAKPAAKKTVQPSAPSTKAKSFSRRDFLRFGRNWGVAIAAVSGVGWYTVRSVQAAIAEHDLSRIGNGLPTIVQIHDPNCMSCLALQREARSAACEVGEDKIQFLVANLQTGEGRRLATAHGVGHVTLLVFDERGRRIDTLVGPNTRDALEQRFLGYL